MLRHALLPIVCVAAALASSASAQNQVSGTVNVTGTVTGRCVANPSSGGGSTVSGTIGLGELAGSDGRLSSALTASVIPGAQQAFEIACNSATPRVQLSATQLSTAATAPAGYASAINYTAEVVVTQASGTPPTIIYTTQSPAGPPVSASLTGPLVSSPGNVVVRVGSLTTTAGALLVAGDYVGLISITVSPS